MWHSLLIFDLDGTLIDSRYDIAASVNRTFRDMNLPEKPPETIYRYVGNGVRQLIVDAIESDAPGLVNQALGLFERHYLAHLLDRTVLYPGVAALLARLAHRKKSVVTNKPLIYTQKILDGLGITKHFDLILGGTPTCRLKPDPEMVLTTLHALNVAPQDALLIGDSPNDILAARSAGVQSCAVGYGGLTPWEEIRSASPDRFVETVADLQAFLASP